jgi:hypothetical protein
LDAHGALLELFEELLTGSPTAAEPSITIEESSCPPELVLALARYAGRLTRFTKSDPEFQIRVHLEERQAAGTKSIYRLDKFDHSPVEQFLNEGPDRALLIGFPGAGKTYSLKRAVSHLGEKLNEACLAEDFEQKSVVVPILTDMKLYRGDLTDLLEQTLPSGLSLASISERFKLRMFVDSFNEMPREQWESGTYEADFSRFLESLKNTTLIICSRTSDGLSRLELPNYCLNEVDEEFIEAELQRRDSQINGRFER